MTGTNRSYFLLLNVGHFLDHFFMLIFATAAALALAGEWQMSYAQLIPYATPGFIAFGVGALPAGWLADKWSRDGMMCLFFFGIGVSSILCGLAQSPVQISVGLLLVGLFGAIYHPVGLAIVTLRWKNIGMRIAVNGVWGNLGVGGAALLTGILISTVNWRAAFILPGVFAILTGLLYLRVAAAVSNITPTATSARKTAGVFVRHIKRVSAIIFVSAALGSITFQSTTFALPKVFDERLDAISRGLAGHLGAEAAAVIGGLTFLVFACASLAQLLVGLSLDRFQTRIVFQAVAAFQCVLFLIMPGLEGWAAYAVALGFMLGVFGQIPINDFLIGQLATGPYRARVYGVRYVVSFSVLALSLPLIAWIHAHWGFDRLFWILAATAAAVFAVVSLLPTDAKSKRISTTT
ncbi:MFS transporter [Ruegeria hyattellae]|uniref:MFS transporter n=1 Tax=Ruegeria hyattellae TaxID=3233337 RepID=UPI00355C5CD0